MLPKPDKRVRLGGGGPYIRSDVAKAINLWRATYGVTSGRIIDALMDFAQKNPQTFTVPLRGRKWKDKEDHLTTML